MIQRVIFLLFIILFTVYKQVNGQAGAYVCPPCNAACDTLTFAKAGTCPHCGMVLHKKKSFETDLLGLDTNWTLHKLLTNLSSTKLEEALGLITDESGARLMGSQSYKISIDQLVQFLREEGIESIRTENFGSHLRNWDLKSFNLEIIEPSYQRLEAFPIAYTEGTQGSIEAPCVFIPNIDELAQYKGKIKGKIVLIGEHYNPQTGVSPIALWRKKLSKQELQRASQNEDPNERVLGYYAKRSTPNAIQFKQKLYDRKAKNIAWLKAEGAVGIIEASTVDFGMLHVDGWGFVPSFYRKDHIKSIPAFVISNEAFGRISRLLKKNREVRLKLDLEVAFPNSTDRHQNLIIDIPGKDPQLKEETVVLGAHLDSWHSSLGVTDNAINCAVLVEALRCLSASGIPNKRTIRFILWGGHEQNFQGSRAYLERHIGTLDGKILKEDAEKTSIYLNLDNGAGRIRGLYLMGNEAIQEPLKAYLAPFSESNTLTSQYANQSDHELFDWMGIPGFQFIQDPLSYLPVTHHTNMDYREYFSMEDQEYNALLVAYLALQAANASKRMPRKAYHSPRPIMDGTTTIRLEAYPNAKSVSVFADFNNWNLYGTKMKKVKGAWECKLDLPPGRHLYKFIIDGDYVAPPHTQQHFKDGKGHGGLAEIIIR